MAMGLGERILGEFLRGHPATRECDDDAEDRLVLTSVEVGKGLHQATPGPQSPTPDGSTHPATRCQDPARRCLLDLH